MCRAIWAASSTSRCCFVPWYFGSPAAAILLLVTTGKWYNTRQSCVGRWTSTPIHQYHKPYSHQDLPSHCATGTGCSTNLPKPNLVTALLNSLHYYIPCTVVTTKQNKPTNLPGHSTITLKSSFDTTESFSLSSLLSLSSWNVIKRWKR